MRKIAGLLILFLLLMPSSVLLADDDECAPINVARNIDAAYTDFLNHRDTMNSDSMMQTADDFSITVQGILANCGSVAASNDPHFIGTAVGNGSLESPYGFGQNGEAINGVSIRPTNIIRPADDIVQQDEPANHEWAIVTVEATCPITNNGDCTISYNNFRLMGESGELYDSEFVLTYTDQLDASIPAGRTREGGIAFIVPNAEANLRLVYYPEPYEFWPDQDVSYYRAQPSVEVTATARLIIRGGPGTMFAPLDALQPDMRAAAIGRNEDSSWIRIDGGWVSSAYVNTTADELALLPVLDPEG